MTPNAPSAAAVDLHLHTCYSDGTLTPAELVTMARAKGLSCIAVTDHDTIASFDEAQAAARAAGLELIPGIELSIQWEREDIHLLVYAFDVAHAGLREWLTTLHAARLERMQQMVARLRQLGVALTVEDVLAIAGPGTVGRLHVARALVARGLVADTRDAFERYLGTHKPAYIAECHPGPDEVLQHVRDARGVPVLAHPAYLENDERVVERLRPLGLAGLEVYHSSHDASQQTRYLRLAERHGLLMTGGSDCHGYAKGQPLVGTVKLPYHHVEGLRAWHAQTYGG